jgi:Uma2 family endonuclease
MNGYKSEDKVYSFEDIDLSGTYSYADYLNWEIDKRLELIGGKIFKMSPAPGAYHQEISAIVLSEIFAFLKNKPCKVYAAPFDVRFPRRSLDGDKDIDTVLQPDISVICDQHKIDKRGCIGAPDIVVEILSPGNSRKELKYKYEVYEEFGVREYWIIQPEEKLFSQYILDENGKFQAPRVLTATEIITSNVLPGFSLTLQEVFG